MSDEPTLSGQDREIQEALHRLRPMRGGLDVRQVLVEAAGRAALRQVWLWRGVAAAMAAGLVVTLFLRSAPRTEQNLVLLAGPPTTVQERTPPQPSAAEPRLPVEPDAELPDQSGNDYLSVRNRMLASGLRALPAASPWVPSPRSIRMVPPRDNSSPEPDPLGDRLDPLAHGVRS